jgi:hypothetical protein
MSVGSSTVRQFGGSTVRRFGSPVARTPLNCRTTELPNVFEQARWTTE